MSNLKVYRVRVAAERADTAMVYGRLYFYVGTISMGRAELRAKAQARREGFVKIRITAVKLLGELL